MHHNEGKFWAKVGSALNALASRAECKKAKNRKIYEKQNNKQKIYFLLEFLHFFHEKHNDFMMTFSLYLTLTNWICLFCALFLYLFGPLLLLHTHRWIYVESEQTMFLKTCKKWDFFLRSFLEFVYIFRNFGNGSSKFQRGIQILTWFMIRTIILSKFYSNWLQNIKCSLTLKTSREKTQPHRKLYFILEKSEQFSND